MKNITFLLALVAIFSLSSFANSQTNSVELQDGTVDATDLSLIDNDAANFTTGYVIEDITGDDFVDASDS